MFSRNKEDILAKYQNKPPIASELETMDVNNLNKLYYEHLPDGRKKVTWSNMDAFRKVDDNSTRAKLTNEGKANEIKGDIHNRFNPMGHESTNRGKIKGSVMEIWHALHPNAWNNIRFVSRGPYDILQREKPNTGIDTSFGTAIEKLKIALNRLKEKVPDLQSAFYNRNSTLDGDAISKESREMIDDIDRKLTAPQNAIIRESFTTNPEDYDPEDDDPEDDDQVELLNSLNFLIEKNIEMSNVLRRGGKRKRRVKKSLKKKKRSNKRKAVNKRTIKRRKRKTKKVKH